MLGHALALLDSCGLTGAPEPNWTLGGGTALMLHIQHRVSRDVDIFLSDPQYLPVLSPRLNPLAEDLTDDYVEQSNFLKLSLREGEIDFIVAPSLTPNASVLRRIDRRPVQLETPSEILAKKLYYRADHLTARDVFDVAAALRADPSIRAMLLPVVRVKRQAVLGRLRRAHETLARDFARLRPKARARDLTFDAAVAAVTTLFDDASSNRKRAPRRR